VVLLLPGDLAEEPPGSLGVVVAVVADLLRPVVPDRDPGPRFGMTVKRHWKSFPCRRNGASYTETGLNVNARSCGSCGTSRKNDGARVMTFTCSPDCFLMPYA